ncbi:MAG: tagaturonate epimerase family protein [Armatimonadota bacterium]
MAHRTHPGPGPTCLGVVRHPAIGIRIPELLLPGILCACQQRDTATGLMLSFGRETAPEAVISAPPGTWEITRGHTGTSIRAYQTMAARAAEKAGVTVEIEADHLIVIGSSTAAVQRIAGYHAKSHISEEELERSLQYNMMAIDEAADVGVVGCFTTDTSDLFWLDADELRAAQVRRLFEERFEAADRRGILRRYRHPRRFTAPGGKSVSVTISETQAMRLALKFCKSLEINARIYEYCREKLGGRPFSFEISLDETAEMTSPRETLFYLTEWKAMGLPCHYFAPNIGFGKRADFRGDMAALQTRVRQHHAIAQGVTGALLSIHSGSGTTPYSGKGRGTYQALLAGTGGDLKYKISGVYFELLLEMLAALPARSEGRRLYNRVFDEVLKLLRREVRQGGPLAQPLLMRQLEQYDRAVARDPSKRRDPRADFFRFNSYLALNLRDERGRRYLRDALVELVQGDADLRERFDAEVAALTLRLIDGLHFANNLA